MSKRLFVGTVFAPSTNNEKWLELQLKFLNDTTNNYDYAVVCNSVSPEPYKDFIVVDASDDMKHDRGLNKLITYAQEKGYEKCLLLDSDCFPFKPNWETELKEVMKQHTVASVMRTDNLDKFQHPCACYLRRAAMSEVRFSRKSGVNLKGDQFEDVQGNATYFYPLLRTNAVNIHPVFCAIYWNAFYHHGAGTRQSTTFRGGAYYRKCMPMLNEFANIGFNKLMEDPKKFIETLSRGHFELFSNKMFI